MQRRIKKTVRYVLSEGEQALLAATCERREFNGNGECEQDHLTRTAAHLAAVAAPELANLFNTLRQLRDLRTSPGLVILESLPRVRDPRRLILIIGSMLGTVSRDIKEGDYVVEIKEQPTNPGERPSFKNAREFYFHTDLSYVPHPPLFLLMHSIVNNQGGGGISLFADVDSITSRLGALDLFELQKPQFLFPAPAHYQGGGVIQLPILSQVKETGTWRLRFRRDNLRAKTRAGMEAVLQLVRAINECAEELLLRSDSLVALDNQSLLHGRTAFAGSSQAITAPRHLNRIYAEL